MIPFDFHYYKPENIDECIALYNHLTSKELNPIYYSGGTEIISMARVDNLRFGAVIDIKGIRECRQLEFSENNLIIGAGVELNKITESNTYPLLSDTLRRIADHTIQCKVTLGGNICGTIIYKEGILPLLISDASVTIASKKGINTKKINEIFKDRMILNKGDLIVNFIIDNKYVSKPYLHIKKTKIEKIDYPLITLNAMYYEGKIRMAFSGLCRNPFRSNLLENIINEKAFNVDKDINRIIDALPEAVLDNHSGTDNYRVFVLKELINNALNEIRGKNA